MYIELYYWFTSVRASQSIYIKERPRGQEEGTESQSSHQKRQINRGHEGKTGKKDRLREIGKNEKSKLNRQRERDPVETERS
jgi:hypothetical protein